MVKSKHRPAQRVLLPNGLWLVMYEPDASGWYDVKLAGYGRRMSVHEVLNRDGGAHVFVSVRDLTAAPKEPTPRGDDLVTVDRNVRSLLDRAAR